MILLAALAMASAAHAAEPAPDGRALFVEKCAMCHRDGGMGTALMARRVDPRRARLEDRDDLQAGFVVKAVRGGIGNMPRIGRAEVSTAQLSAIAAYLAAGQVKAAP
jgi:mono/diheme cytochrome c family protein